MIAALLLAACSAGVDARGEVPPAAAPTAAPAPAAAAPKSTDELVFRGACDASGAAWGPDGRLWIADDERNILRSWAATGGEPGATLDLGLGADEADLEAAATVGDRIWWIGSHGRNKNGKERPARQVLLTTDASGRVLGRTGALLPALLALPELGPALRAAEPNPPKENGISIEGLAADGQDLWMGFRSPLATDGRAWVVKLTAPGDALNGTIGLEAPLRLDLGGRGVRSMDWDPARKAWWIVAGPPGKGGDFALYRWDGQASAPARVDVDVDGLGVEGLVVAPDGRLLVLADDGTRPVGGVECKEAPEAQRSFRARWLTPPAGN